MKVTPLCLRLTRFGSFVGPATFPFPREPGLYFIQGVNDAETRLEANGSGKTTLSKALTWCLFGKTPEGLKAGDVCTWGFNSGTEVDFDFLLDDNEDCIWTMRRTWSPNSWTLSHVAEFITDEEVVDLSKDEANPVLAAVRVAFEPFLHSVLIAQKREMFLDLDKSRQAQLLADILNLEAWAERSDRAKKRADEQDGASRRLERELADCQGRLEALDDRDAGLASERWEQRRQDDLDELHGAFDAGVIRRRSAKKAVEDCEAALEDAQAKVRAGRDPEKDRLPEWLKAARGEERNLEDMIRDGKTQLRGLDAREEDLLDEKAPCPLCGHRLDAADRQKHLKATQAEISMVCDTLREREAKLAKAAAASQQIEKQIEEWGAMTRAADEALRWAERNLADARRNLQIIDKDLDGVEDRIETVEHARNPHSEGLEKQRAEVAKLRDRFADLTRELDDSHWRHSIYSHWVKWFKELRLRAIGEGLAELEIEVNSAVAALGLVDWEVSFSVDKETKGGGVQRGFTVLVRSPESGGKQVPWESWSGGEGQRLMLATQMGLGDLTRARTGCDFPLEVWDEPTAGLSARGLEDLFVALAERAHHEGRVIFLVDHKAHSFGGFAGTAVVTKTWKKGSDVKTSWA